MPKFTLECTACSFGQVVDGTIGDVYDRVDEHQAEMEPAPADHNVDFVRLEDPSQASNTP